MITDEKGRRVPSHSWAEGFAGLAQDLQSLRKQRDELVAALAELVERCDGDEGVRPDGSNIQTMGAHAVLKRVRP